MKDTCSPAIARFQSIGEVVVNDKAVYATYVSGVYHYFFQTEDEAISSTSDSAYGVEFNKAWFQATYTTYSPGELFFVKGTHNVYVTSDTDRYPDAIADISFVEWAFMPEKG